MPVFDSFIALGFLLSSLYLVFAREVIPNEDSLNIPSIHYYFKSKYTSYGLITAFGLVFSSFVFVILTFGFSFRLSYSALVAWGIMIFILIYSTKKAQLTQQSEIIADYISRMLKLDFDEVFNIIYDLENINQNPGSKKSDHPSTLAKAEIERVLVLYLKYRETGFEELTPEEIDENNKK